MAEYEKEIEAIENQTFLLTIHSILSIDISLVVDAMEIPFNYSEISLTTILKLSSLHSHIISIIIIVVVVVN